MPQRLLIFNVDNDMAVANGSPYFMPPRRIFKMMDELSLLTAYYANEGDSLLTDLIPSPNFLLERKAFIPTNLSFISTQQLNECPIVFDAIEPWGWSPRLYYQLRQLLPHVAPHAKQHPCFSWSDSLRKYYSKAIVIDALQWLLPRLSPYHTNFLPQLYTSAEAVIALTEQFPIVVKAPLSGAGKGVRFISKQRLCKLDREWTEGIIKQQGTVSVARMVEKKSDFSMQFYAHRNGEVEFIGLSTFSTNENGAYTGSHLCSQHDHAALLCQWVDENELLTIRHLLLELLPKLIGKRYEGHLGIDMMVFEDKTGAYRIHPFVEMNLRRNMGMLSIQLFNKMVYNGKRGKFVIEYSHSPTLLQTTSEEWEITHPRIYKAGKLAQGYFGLTPITPTTQYHAYINIE